MRCRHATRTRGTHRGTPCVPAAPSAQRISTFLQTAARRLTRCAVGAVFVHTAVIRLLIALCFMTLFVFLALSVRMACNTLHFVVWAWNTTVVHHLLSVGILMIWAMSFETLSALTVAFVAKMNFRNPPVSHILGTAPRTAFAYLVLCVQEAVRLLPFPVQNPMIQSAVTVPCALMVFMLRPIVRLRGILNVQAVLRVLLESIGAMKSLVLEVLSPTRVVSLVMFVTRMNLKSVLVQPGRTDNVRQGASVLLAISQSLMDLKHRTPFADRAPHVAKGISCTQSAQHTEMQSAGHVHSADLANFMVDLCVSTPQTSVTVSRVHCAKAMSIHLRFAVHGRIQFVWN